MSEVFDGYERHYCEISASLSRKCTSAALLDGGDDNISKSKRILSALSRRMDGNKWIIGGIIVALVLVVILILYFKLAH